MQTASLFEVGVVARVSRMTTRGNMFYVMQSLALWREILHGTPALKLSFF